MARARKIVKTSAKKAVKKAAVPKLDAITLEILRNRFSEICGTMEHLLFHSGYSTILRESHDGSAGILDRDGNTVDTSGDILHVNP